SVEEGILGAHGGCRAPAGIAVERAGRDADGFRLLAVRPEEGRAARAAELARDALRRTKGAKRALAALETEAPLRKTGVGRERRSSALRHMPQWQCVVWWSFPSISYRTAPQRHPAANVGCMSGRSLIRVFHPSPRPSARNDERRRCWAWRSRSAGTPGSCKPSREKVLHQAPIRPRAVGTFRERGHEINLQLV